MIDEEEEIVEEFSETELGEIRDMLEERVDRRTEPEKLRQYLDVKRAINYFEGRQALTYDDTNGYLDLVPYTGVNVGGDDDDDDEVFDCKLNIVRGDGRKYIALMGNRSPNPKAIPDNPLSDMHRRRAKKADALGHLLYNWWDMKEAHRDICQGQWTSGTQFLHTPWVVNALDYGTSKEIKWGSKVQTAQEAGFECEQCGTRNPQPGPCSNCGAPVFEENFREAVVTNVPFPEGEEEFPNGRVELHIYDATNVTVTFYGRRIEKVPYLRLDIDVHVGEVIDKFPDLRGELLDHPQQGGDSASESVGRATRQEVNSPSGLRKDDPDLVTCLHYWLKPMMFHLIKDEALRKKLQEKCPEGARIIQINKKVRSVVAERLDHVWAVVQPETGRTIFRQPLAKDHVDVQDIYNLLMSIGLETLDRGVAWMMADPDVVDFEQLASRVRRPAEVVPIRKGRGMSLHESVKEAPSAEMSNELIPFADSVVERARENVGILRAAWGGEPVGGEQTAKEYVGRRNQALMQLTNPWDCIRAGLASALKNGVRQLLKYGPDKVEAPVNEGKGGFEALDLSDMTMDGWRYWLEETIPVTPGEKSDRITMLMQNPEIAQAMRLLDVSNAPVLQDLMGLMELKNVDVSAVEAAKKTINQLIHGKAMEEPDPMTGEMIRVPSIQPKWEENSEICVAVAKAWCLDEGADLVEQFPDGYLNVIAWGEAHEKRLAPPPMPEGEQPEGGNKWQNEMAA